MLKPIQLTTSNYYRSAQLFNFSKITLPVKAPAPAPTPPLPEQSKLPPSSAKKRLRQWGREELEPLYALLTSAGFYLSWCALGLTFLATYQLPFSKSISMDVSADRVYLTDYYAREEYQSFVYRWTKPSSNIVLPGVGQPARVQVQLELAPRPGADQNNQPVVSPFINSNPLTPFQVTAGPRRTYTLDYTPKQQNWLDSATGTLNLWLTVNPPFQPKGEQRALGVVVGQITVATSGWWQSGRPTVPPWNIWAWLMAAITLVNLALRRSGWGSRAANGFMLLAGAIIALGLIADRSMVALGATELVIALLVGYGLLVAGLRFTGWWLTRRVLLFERKNARWLGLVFLLVFTVRAAGINHPSFQPLDHAFRIHQVYALLDQPGLIISRYYNVNTAATMGGKEADATRSYTAGQLGVAISIPYSPLFYISDFWLGALLRQNEGAFLFWTNLYALWWQCWSVFLLYILARQLFGRFGNTAGLLAGVFMGFWPVTFLMPSDGGYPSMQAEWLSLLFLVLATAGFSRNVFNPALEPVKPRRSRIWWGGLVLGLALLAHTATMLMLSSLIAGLIIWLALNRPYRWLSRYLTAVFAVGLVIAVGIYYGFYLIPLLTQSLPTLASKIGQGQSVGVQNETLPGFWNQLGGHFQLWPFFLTVIVAGYLAYCGWVRPKREFAAVQPLNFRESVRNEISKPAIWLLLTWLVVFLTFSLLDYKVNLLQKHMLFGIELMALACGLGLAWLLELARRYRNGYDKSFSLEPAKPGLMQKALPLLASVIIGLLVVYVVYNGSFIWFQRVINYVLPAGTG